MSDEIKHHEMKENTHHTAHAPEHHAQAHHAAHPVHGHAAPKAPPVPAELTGLIADKEKEAKEAQDPRLVSGAAKTILGGFVGGMAATVTWLGALTKKSIDLVKSKGDPEKFLTDFGKLSEAEQQRASEKLAKELLHDSKGITGAIVRNPGTTVLVGTIAGAGYMLSSHVSTNDKAKTKANNELSALKSTADKWQDRLNNAEVVPGPHSHAIH